VKPVVPHTKSAQICRTLGAHSIMIRPDSYSILQLYVTTFAESCQIAYTLWCKRPLRCLGLTSLMRTSSVHALGSAPRRKSMWQSAWQKPEAVVQFWCGYVWATVCRDEDPYR